MFEDLVLIDDVLDCIGHFYWLLFCFLFLFCLFYYLGVWGRQEKNISVLVNVSPSDTQPYYCLVRQLIYSVLSTSLPYVGYIFPH